MDSADPSLDDGTLAAPRARQTKAAVATTNPLIVQPLPRWLGQPAGSGLGPAAGARAGHADPAILSPDARAGAALFALDQVLRTEAPWAGCLRMRLALQAALASVRLLRLSADEGALRDAEHLTRPGDDPGPAGRVHRLWRRFGQQPTRLAGETMAALMVETGADTGTGGKAGEGATEVVALMQADAELARTLGWDKSVPLAATVIADPAWRAGRERRPFRVGGEGWEARRMALFGLAAARAHALAVGLSRRADALTVAAETLRTRDDGAGVRLILGDDGVAPWRMAKESEAGKGGQGKEGLGSDRAARRFCESLHAMGVLRLLTDRATFRLYGL